MSYKACSDDDGFFFEHRMKEDLTALKAMMPYVFAAGHVNCAKYGLHYHSAIYGKSSGRGAGLSLASEHVMQH